MGEQRHVVRQGDHLARIAYQLGCKPNEIWDHPGNAELRELRGGKGELLHPGDLLVVPEADPAAPAVQSGTSNDYAAPVPTVVVDLRLVMGDEPYADEDYEVQGLGDTKTGTTDGEGRLKFEAPVTAREATLLLVKLGWTMPLKIGDMDPLAEASGVMKRLVQLGYLDEVRPSDDADYLAIGVRAFQCAKGLPETGELDDATRSALSESYGC